MYQIWYLLLTVPVFLNNQKVRATPSTFDTPYYQLDPDQDLTVPQIIRRHGYPSQSHVVESEDGYLLTVHRIPGDKSGTPGGQAVYLQHGLLGSSADWVLNGNNTFAFHLADSGYDVWLGNARGNIYSRAHVSLPTSSSQFWNFSWHEIATKDLPAVLYHISNTTGKAGDIIYIGHSMGTTVSFVLASTLPQVAKNLRLIVALAPTVFMTHLRSPIRYLAPFTNDIAWLARFLGVKDLAPTNKVLELLSFECEKSYGKAICSNLLFLLAGFNQQEFNMTMLPKVAAHDPAGASTKTLLHYAQEIRDSGNFQQYNYGTQGNLIKYGTTTPPKYNLGKVKRPIYMVYAQNDILTSYIDVLRLSKKLTSLVGMYEVPNPIFGHVDFIFGIDAFELVYEPVVQFLKNFTNVV